MLAARDAGDARLGEYNRRRLALAAAPAAARVEHYAAAALRKAAPDGFLMRSGLIQPDQDHLANHQVNSVGTVGHALEGRHHCRIRHGRVHANCAIARD